MKEKREEGGEDGPVEDDAEGLTHFKEFFSRVKDTHQREEKIHRVPKLAKPSEWMLFSMYSLGVWRKSFMANSGVAGLIQRIRF